MPKEMLMMTLNLTIENLTEDELTLLEQIMEYVSETKPFYSQDPDFDSLYDKIKTAV